MRSSEADGFVESLLMGVDEKICMHGLREKGLDRHCFQLYDEALVTRISQHAFGSSGQKPAYA